MRLPSLSTYIRELIFFCRDLNARGKTRENQKAEFSGLVTRGLYGYPIALLRLIMHWKASLKVAARHEFPQLERSNTCFNNAHTSEKFIN